MARYHAKNARIYMSASGTGTAAPLAGAAAWSLNKATDRVETTAFGDSNKQYVQGFADVSGDFTVVWDDTDDTAFDASEASDGCKIYLYPSTLVSTIYHYGPAWVDVTQSAAVDGRVELSGTFVARGDWGRKPA